MNYTVRFIGHYFSTIVNLEEIKEGENDEITLVALANNILMEHYGWDVEAVSTIEIEVTEV